MSRKSFTVPCLISNAPFKSSQDHFEMLLGRTAACILEYIYQNTKKTKAYINYQQEGHIWLTQSQEEIARVIRCSVRTVERAILKMKEAQFIVVAPQYSTPYRRCQSMRLHQSVLKSFLDRIKGVKFEACRQKVQEFRNKTFNWLKELFNGVASLSGFKDICPDKNTDVFPHNVGPSPYIYNKTLLIKEEKNVENESLCVENAGFLHDDAEESLRKIEEFDLNEGRTSNNVIESLLEKMQLTLIAKEKSRNRLKI